MAEDKSRIHNSQWRIASFKRPILWVRHVGECGEPDETWNMNPPLRYVLNANQLSHVEEHIETISDMKNAAMYKPLQGNVNLAGAKILVERYRERGIGDLLFLTGPLSYLYHLSGATCKLYVYTLADRAATLQGHPAIANGTPLCGPLFYDSFSLYHHHWLIDTVTEYDEEQEQLNVYDALYRQLGVDPATVDPRFKRPSITLDNVDQKNLDSFYFFVWNEKKVDLRRTGYYVVAPLSHSSLRSANYGMWLSVIHELAQRRPVIVLGQVTERMPVSDMPAEEFNQRLAKLHPGVVNMLGHTPLRVVMAMISKAVAVVCLDSAPLYIAEAFRVPAISLWGPHHPGVRIGYDKDYMDLAIWNQSACRHSPCFAYNGFPISLCPRGDQQQVCEVLGSITVEQVVEKVNVVEAARRGPPLTELQRRLSSLVRE